MTLAKYVEVCSTYFQYRNIGRWGFVKYSVIKNLIRYITNLRCDRKVRRVFEALIYSGEFELRRPRKNVLLYLYNPTNRKYKYKMNGLVEYVY